ncbi:MAG: tryptophan 7-halogenase [Alteraurantiacibacter sp.]
MSAPRERLRRVCVVGGGQVGVIAAVALRRALPDCQVIVIGTPADPGAYADRAPTALPFTNRFHEQLGIDEQAIVARAGGSHRLLARYLGWGGPGSVGAMAYGAQLDAQWRTRFAREWGGGSRNAAGTDPAAGAGSLAEVLANAGRFAVPPGDRATPLDMVEHGLRWNSPAYRDLLITAAAARQVVHIPGIVASAERDGEGGLASITVPGQGAIEADLFIDCNGPAGSLIALVAGDEWEDWHSYLPVRHLFHARPGQPLLALEDRCTLLPQGWLAALAGRDGLQLTLGFGDKVTEAEARTALPGQPEALVEIVQGCRPNSWVGNVVALGDAAAWFEPLGHLNLDLAHRQLAALLDLLPGREIEPLERAEYNRRTLLMAHGARDVLALHYATPAARAVFGEMPLPGSVAHTLDQFTRRGRVPFHEEAPFAGAEQTALLLALGYSSGSSPQASGNEPREAAAARREFDQRASAALAFAPPYRDFITGGAAASSSIAADLQY